MKENSYKYYVLSLTLFLVTTLVSFLFTDNLPQSIIFGLLVGIVSALFEMHFLVVSSNSQMKHLADEANRQFMKLLEIDNEFYEDEWLHEKLKELVKIRRETEGKRMHVRKQIEEEINKSVEQAARMVLSSFRIPCSENDELERMRRLKMATEDAKEYVFAVTYDAHGFIDKFWSGEFYREYIQVNAKAASNGAKVKIKRVFIVDQEVINGGNQDKREKLEDIVRNHLKFPNIEIRVICKDQLPSSWKGCDTSFLVCDDCVASESCGLSNSQNIEGYVVYNDRDIVEMLKKRFEELLLAPSVDLSGFLSRKGKR